MHCRLDPFRGARSRDTLEQYSTYARGSGGGALGQPRPCLRWEYPLDSPKGSKTFATKRRNAVWVGDVTYTATARGWLCASPVQGLSAHR
jgi:hypothetical protein